MMKKTLWVLALVGCLTMGLSVAALASNVYVAGFGGGEWENELGMSKDDGDQKLGFVIGGEYHFLDKFKVGLEYLSGSQEKADNGKDLDYEAYEVKFGYRLLELDRFNLDATVAYYNESYDDKADTEIDGIILGADMSYLINDKFSVAGTLGFSVDGSIDAKGAAYNDNNADLWIAKVQGNYHFDDQWTGFLGYRYVTSDIHHFDNLTNQGITLGVGYSF